MKTMILILAIILSGCSDSGTTATIDNVAIIPDPVTPIVPPVFVPPIEGVQVQINLKTHSKVTTPAGHDPTVTITSMAFCFQYRGADYCFDDGPRTVQTTNPFSGTVTTWTLNYFKQDSGGYCATVCDDHLAFKPKAVSSFPAVFGNPLTAMNWILANGTSSIVNCSELNNELICPNFKLAY